MGCFVWQWNSLLAIVLPQRDGIPPPTYLRLLLLLLLLQLQFGVLSLKYRPPLLHHYAPRGSGFLCQTLRLLLLALVMSNHLCIGMYRVIHE